MNKTTVSGMPLVLAVGFFAVLGLHTFAQRPAPASGKSTVPAPVSDDHSKPSASLDSDTQAVNIFAVVSDKHGGVVQNLKREDFEIQADKKPQTITTFSSARDLPLTVGLIVNSSPAQRDALEEERTASAAFLTSLLGDPERTKAFVVQFSREVDLLQDTTGSKEQVRAAIAQLETDRESRVEAVDTGSPDQRGGSQPNPQAGRYPGRGSNGGNGAGRGAQIRRANNALYDALFLSSDEIAKKQAGRKVLILLSDGDDSGSKESLTSAIEAAQRANSVIYAVYYKERQPSDRGGFTVSQGNNCDSGYPGGYPGSYPGGYPGGYPDDCSSRLPESRARPDGRKTLERICSETGGRMFEADKKETLANIYKQISDDLNAQYRLTFVPDKDASSDGYHHVLLTIAKPGSKDLAVQARDGYYKGD